MKSTRLLEGIAVLLAAPWFAQCREGDAAPSRTETKAPAEPGATPRASAEPTKPAPTTAPALEAPPNEVPAAAGDLGSWADSSSYRFKVSGSKRCSPAPASGGTEAELLLGLSVEILAKYDELWVASRDIKLESGGIILDSEADPKVTAGCAPLLRTQQLEQKRSASGVVVFKVPPEFDTSSVLVSYRATRWGGAPRLEVRLPAPALSVALKR